MVKKHKKEKKEKVKRSRKHTRIIDTLTGQLERPTLRWLAAHLPAWVTPDMLTGFGFFGALLTAVSFVLSNQNSAWLWLASLGFVINWYGDSLDGTLARYRHIERPRYGYFLDHCLDALSTTLIFFGLGLSPYVRFEIAAVALAGYLLLSIYAVLATYVADEFKISYAYLGPTEIRIIAILCNTVVFYNDAPFVRLLGGFFTFYELIILGLIVLFYAAFILSSADQGARLAKIEPAGGMPAALPSNSHHPSPQPSQNVHPTPHPSKSHHPSPHPVKK